MPTHFRGPLLGDGRSGGGLFDGVSLTALDPADWAVYHNDFRPGEYRNQNTELAASAHAPTQQEWTEAAYGTLDTSTVVKNGISGEIGSIVLRPSAQDEGITVQSSLHHLAFLPATITPRKTVVMATRIKVEDLTNQNFYWGLSDAAAASVMTEAGVLSTAGTSRAGFHHSATANDGTAIRVETRFDTNRTVTTESAFDMSDDQFVTLGMRVEDRYDGTASTQWVSYYHRLQPSLGNPASWVKIGTHVSGTGTDENFPSTPLLVSYSNASIAAVNPDADFLWIDYLTFALDRRNS